jgi:hypothetical protein
MAATVHPRIKGDARELRASWHLDAVDLGELTALELGYGDTLTLTAGTALTIDIRPRARKAPTIATAIVTRHRKVSP